MASKKFDEALKKFNKSMKDKSPETQKQRERDNAELPKYPKCETHAVFYTSRDK